MPANTSPIFVLNSNIGRARITAANTASDGSGVVGSTIFDLITGSTNGTRVDSITITNSSNVVSGTTSANTIRVFITDSVGTNPRLLQEISLSAVAKSQTAAGATTTINFAGGLFLVSGQKIQVTQSVYLVSGIDQNDVVARGGNY